MQSAAQVSEPWGGGSAKDDGTVQPTSEWGCWLPVKRRKRQQPAGCVWDMDQMLLHIKKAFSPAPHD